MLKKLNLTRHQRACLWSTRLLDLALICLGALLPTVVLGWEWEPTLCVAAAWILGTMSGQRDGIRIVTEE